MRSIILLLFIGGAVHATDTVVVRQKVVQFDANTYLGTNGYYAHGQQLRAQRQTQDDEAIAELKEQNKILRELVAAVLAGKGNTNVPPIKPEEPPVPEPPVDNMTDIERGVFKIFSDNCVKCHGQTKADGGLSLIKDNKLTDLSLGKMVLTHHRTNGINLNGDAQMPKGSPALTDEQVETIRLWIVEKVLRNE